MSHLKDMKENYLTHLIEALLIVLSLLKAAAACLVHAFVPFIFKTTASSIMKKTLQKTEDRYVR
jgi:uncharacterized membrane protein